MWIWFIFWEVGSIIRHKLLHKQSSSFLPSHYMNLSNIYIPPRFDTNYCVIQQALINNIDHSLSQKWSVVFFHWQTGNSRRNYTKRWLYPRKRTMFLRIVEILLLLFQLAIIKVQCWKNRWRRWRSHDVECQRQAWWRCWWRQSLSSARVKKTCFLLLLSTLWRHRCWQYLMMIMSACARGCSSDEVRNRSFSISLQTRS